METNLRSEEKIRPHIKCVIGHGKTVSYWHDKWWEGCVLSEAFPIYDLPEAKNKIMICDMISDGVWKLSKQWTIIHPQLNSIPIPNLMECDDRVMWENNKGEVVKFSISNMWKDWIQGEEKVAWHKVVWFSQCTPKHSFILWLTILMRLSTQDRIAKWFPGRNTICPLCEECLESHNHLFFKCSYSEKIWTEMRKKSSLNFINNEWEVILKRVIEMSCNNSIRSVLRRLILATCVYYIWDERNKRLFGNQKRDYKTVLLIIINHIRIKLTSLKVKNFAQVARVNKVVQVKN
ncbi:reverse transcriptase zinc-binding domain-containing protein [Tanacetum coccineum]